MEFAQQLKQQQTIPKPKTNKYIEVLKTARNKLLVEYGGECPDCKGCERLIGVEGKLSCFYCFSKSQTK